jgi:hypothetical protein
MSFLVELLQFLFNFSTHITVAENCSCIHRVIVVKLGFDLCSVKLTVLRPLGPEVIQNFYNMRDECCLCHQHWIFTFPFERGQDEARNISLQHMVSY